MRSVDDSRNWLLPVSFLVISNNSGNNAMHFDGFIIWLFLQFCVKQAALLGELHGYNVAAYVGRLRTKTNGPWGLDVAMNPFISHPHKA